MNKAVAITGMSVVSALGEDLRSFRTALFSGMSGVRDMRGDGVPRNFPVSLGAPLLKGGSIAAERNTALTAGRMAEHLRTECLGDQDVDGVIWAGAEGSSFSAVNRIMESDFQLSERDLPPLFSQEPLEAILTSLRVNKRAESGIETICLDNSCVSGNLCIGLAAQRIRSGQWRRAIVGAARFACEAEYLMRLYLLGVLAVDDGLGPSPRPFDARRNGFVVGEAAGMILLESVDEARARGAKLLGAVSGFSNTVDSWGMTAGRPDAAGGIAAVRLALGDAGLLPVDIDYVNAHGTGTRMNDILETKTIVGALGRHAHSIPVSTLKPQTGHALQACGIIECIACVLMLQEQVVAPTLNYSQKESECNLDYVPNVARKASLQHILSNSFAFGGQNACLIVSAGVD